MVSESPLPYGLGSVWGRIAGGQVRNLPHWL